MPFKGIADLRSVEEHIELTEEQLIEWHKCADDPIYFIKTYVKILTIDEGMSSFQLRQYQEDLIQFFLNNRFTIGRIPRQMGKSSCAGSFMLWNAIFHKETFNVIMCSKYALSKGFLSNIKLSYKNLPQWIQVGVVKWEKDYIDFGNGSKITCSSSIEHIKGSSIDFLYVDEFAYFPLHYSEEFLDCLMPILASTSNSRLIILSTPSRSKTFRKIWDAAVSGIGGFKPIRLYWHQVPGRDDTWAREMVRTMGQRFFDQEFNCDFVS